MKFCSLLRDTAEGIPELSDLYAAYKRLKKILREVGTCNQTGNIEQSIELQSSFISDVNSCLQQVNEGFMEKEEEIVISFDNLERASGETRTLEDCQTNAKKFVDFHGRLLLFMNTTMLTYVCILKIMKKYRKKTGHIVMSLQPQQLKEMPIGSTEIISSIVHRCEQSINFLIARQIQLRNELVECKSDSKRHKLNEEEVDMSLQGESSENASSLVGQVRLALRTWEQLKTTAVTPSTVLTDTIMNMTSDSTTGSVSSTSSSVKSDTQ